MTSKVAMLNLIGPEGTVEISPRDASLPGIAQDNKVKKSVLSAVKSLLKLK